MNLNVEGQSATICSQLIAGVIAFKKSISVGYKEFCDEKSLGEVLEI